jgi:uncharacterized protein YceK
MRKILCSVILIGGLAGCGTTSNVFSAFSEHPSHQPLRVYGGVCFDFGVFFVSSPPFGALFALIDFPFSLLGDTLTLPITIPFTIDWDKRESAESSPKKPQ